ncbi:hypothetical protein RBA25_004020 [Cronobacter turicensis]|nr:hypothetical protein [Cronobacter turicensis]
MQFDYPVKLAEHCYVSYIKIESWHFTLSEKIKHTAQQISIIIMDDYKRNAGITEFVVFAGTADGYWIVGAATNPSEFLREKIPSLRVSSRAISRKYNQDCISLIIENELNKMPISITHRH